MAKAMNRLFWWYILSIPSSTTDRGPFSSHFLLYVDKMCFPSSVYETFLKKCWRAQFLSQNGQGADPFFGVIYHFNFNAHNGLGSIFPATSFYPWIKCVSLSSVCESFLKKCSRAQFYLKMAKALTYYWVINHFNFNAHIEPRSIFLSLPSIRR